MRFHTNHLRSEANLLSLRVFFNPWWQKTTKLWLVYWQNDWNELLVCRLYQNNIVSFGQTKSLVFVFLLWLGSVGAHGSRKSYVAKMSHRAFAGLIQWSRSCVHANSSLYLQSVKKITCFCFVFVLLLSTPSGGARPSTYFHSQCEK